MLTRMTCFYYFIFPRLAIRLLTRREDRQSCAGKVGKDGFEPPNSEEDRFTVCCRWPLGYLPIYTNTMQVL